MEYRYDHDPLEKLFTEQADPLLIVDHLQTFLYVSRREMSPETFEALDEEHRSLAMLKLALRETKPVK
jgi:hypothetical protein